MPTTQTAMVVTNQTSSIKDLNDHLEMGWKVVNSCPMPSSLTVGEGYSLAQVVPTCLVILEGEV